MVGNKIKFHIGFITDEGFPSGMSTTNRIASMAKGLVLLKHDVTIFCVRPTEKSNNIINFEIEGKSNGINFIYTANTIKWPDSIAGKFLSVLKGFIGFFLHYRRKNKNNKFDFIICTTSNYFYNYWFCKYIKFFKGVPVIAIDEYPHVLRNKSEYNGYFSKFYLRNFYKFFDGAIVMTKILIDFYKPLLKMNVPILHLPMSVEAERFQVKFDSPFDFDYIAYCGNLGQNQKDGVPILIEAFSIVKKKYHDIKLIIIGSANPSVQDEVFNNLRTIANNYNVANDIIFTGKIHRDNMPKYLVNAKILALARPDSLQSQGGFPTKLGEYLATGKPVVVTSVGEIPLYLTDSINAFVAKPDSPTSFAERMLFLLDNSQLAHQVGIEGKKLANTIFNYKVQSVELFNFLMLLRK